MGLLAYSRLDATLRATESGIAALQTYGAVEDIEEGEEDGGSENKKEE
ncbi:MAG: hypothetical protein JZD41_07595 [Thermoproteus sp.]|nr:hypothetical protein [Thermoproteus sp.]